MDEMTTEERQRREQFYGDQRVIEWQYRTYRKGDSRREDKQCDDMGTSTSPGWENAVRVIEEG